MILRSFVNHSIIEFSFSSVHRDTFFIKEFWIVFRDFSKKEKRPSQPGGQQIYSTLCVVRQSSVVLSTATFTAYLPRVQYRVSQVDRILLVQGFGNGTSTKTTAGKPFGRRRVKWWLSVRNLSDARYITAKLRKRMRKKPLRYLRKYDF